MIFMTRKVRTSSQRKKIKVQRQTEKGQAFFLVHKLMDGSYEKTEMFFGRVESISDKKVSQLYSTAPYISTPPPLLPTALVDCYFIFYTYVILKLLKGCYLPNFLSSPPFFLP